MTFADLTQDFIGGFTRLAWWGPSMSISILCVGLFLMVRLAFMPLRKFGYALQQLWLGRHAEGVGDISAFRALMTSLSATIGTGNIVGTATAIAIGGPGALFWIWVTAPVGMAIRYAEVVCAITYRETDSHGEQIGGPMYYIVKGLGRQWRWLAILFALLGAIAAFGIGNMAQSNSLAAAMSSNFGVAPLPTSLILIALVTLVLIGGIKNIGAWVSKLVPSMAILYLGVGLFVLLCNVTEIPSALAMITMHAFTGTATIGGFTGATFILAFQIGLSHGIFSNEAGLGSAPIAHAAAKTDNPVKQGAIASLGPFIDTFIVCSTTGMVIVVTGAWESGKTGIDLTTAAFSTQLPLGQYIVAVALIIFAFTSILGWSYYGEKCWQFIFGAESVYTYRILWILAVFIGPWALTWEAGGKFGITLIWLISDLLNALMALPNLLALGLLSPVLVKLTKEYWAKP